MIADLVRKDDLRGFFAAWKNLVTTARVKMAERDPEALQLAAEQGWTDEDLRALEELFTEAEAGFNKPDDDAFIPGKEALSFVQTILDDTYNTAGLVAEPSGQKLFSSIFDEPNPLFLTEGARGWCSSAIGPRGSSARTSSAR